MKNHQKWVPGDPPKTSQKLQKNVPKNDASGESAKVQKSDKTGKTGEGVQAPGRGRGRVNPSQKNYFII